MLSSSLQRQLDWPPKHSTGLSTNGSCIALTIPVVKTVQAPLPWMQLYRYKGGLDQYSFGKGKKLYRSKTPLYRYNCVHSGCASITISV